MVYEAGVKLISTITNTYISVIQTAVTKIVNAFQAFVTWAIDFVCDAILDPLTLIFGTSGAAW